MAKGKKQIKKKTKKVVAKVKAKTITKVKIKKKAAPKKAVKKILKKSVAKATAPKAAKATAPKAAKKSAPRAAQKSAKPTKSPPKKEIKNWDEVLSPVDDRLLVEELTPAGERITAGGLIIPDTVAMSGYKTAKVLSVGPGRRDKTGKRHPLGVEKNETVIFEEYSGIEIKIFERDLKLVKESEILGIKTK